MKKKYMLGKSSVIYQCLVKMEEGTTNLEAEGNDAEEETYLTYTRAWLKLVNRGGLFTVNEQVYTFFQELEVCIYPMLAEKLKMGAGPEKDEMVQKIEANEDILFAWSLITVDLSRDDSHLLLTDIILLWMTIRGYAIASSLVEDYKEAMRTTTKGKKPLRKQLFQNYK